MSNGNYGENTTHDLNKRGKKLKKKEKAKKEKRLGPASISRLMD